MDMKDVSDWASRQSGDGGNDDGGATTEPADTGGEEASVNVHEEVEGMAADLDEMADATEEQDAELAKKLRKISKDMRAAIGKDDGEEGDDEEEGSDEDDESEDDGDSGSPFETD